MVNLNEYLTTNPHLPAAYKVSRNKPAIFGQSQSKYFNYVLSPKHKRESESQAANTTLTKKGIRATPSLIGSESGLSSLPVSSKSGKTYEPSDFALMKIEDNLDKLCSFLKIKTPSSTFVKEPRP